MAQVFFPLHFAIEMVFCLGRSHLDVTVASSFSYSEFCARNQVVALDMNDEAINVKAS